jgi:hypothetical protein
MHGDTLISLHTHQHLVSVLLNTVIIINVKWLTVTLICISQMANDTKAFFHVLTDHVPSLVKDFFKYLDY